MDRQVLPGAHFDILDLYTTPTDAFDIVLCSEVLEHLLHPDRALTNLLAMVRPGGLALITVPNGRVDQYHGHINFWSPESWGVFLAQGAMGCKVETGLCTKTSFKCNYAIIHKLTPR